MTDPDLAEFAKLVKPTSGGLFRLARWRDIGRPSADLKRLVFAGRDSVRRLVIDVIRCLPPPVAHYAIECIVWRESGRGNSAWIGGALVPRALAGDRGHEVNICGRERDEDLRGVLGHEVGHGMHRPVVEPMTPELSAQIAMLTPTEALAGRILLYRRLHLSPDERQLERAYWIGGRVTAEQLADRQAEAWGFHHRGPDDDELRRQFARDYDEAAKLAEQIGDADEDSTGADVADLAARADNLNQGTKDTTMNTEHDDTRSPWRASEEQRTGQSTSSFRMSESRGSQTQSVA